VWVRWQRPASESRPYNGANDCPYNGPYNGANNGEVRNKKKRAGRRSPKKNGAVSGAIFRGFGEAPIGRLAFPRDARI